MNNVFEGSDCAADAPIVYVQATGRRGNIVQTYPAIEYKFVHEEMEVPYGACLLWQWGNSWFNENQNPNNAEGWRYSDAHNVVEVKDLAHNFPRGHYTTKDGNVEQYVSGFFNEVESKFFALQDQAEILQAGVRATANNAQKKSFTCKKETEVDDDDNHPLLCGKLNLPRGKIQYATVANTPGMFKFMSTRNNNFSNRKQTMSISVGSNPNLSSSETAGAVVGSIFGIGAVAFGVIVILGFLGVIKVGFIENIKNKKKKAQTGNDSSTKYTAQVEKKTQV